MINIHQVIIDKFVEELNKSYKAIYSDLDNGICNILAWAGQLSLENLSNSDALYHNVEHTLMVTTVGQAILRGKHLLEGGVRPRDWLHVTLALLFHDIGFVNGVCKDDKNGLCADGLGNTIELPLGVTDISLTPYHVDRSKLFIKERFGGKLLFDVDPEIVTSYIEMTRFPIPDDEYHKNTTDFAGLVRAADFIGQLGDPNYLRKIPALYYEFHEIGMNEKLGYTSPDDMRKSYAKFYWNVVNKYIQTAKKYLRVTLDGKQWIANLQSHVFDIEHETI